MDFNYDNSINSNNNLPERFLENIDADAKKQKKSIFNRYFEKDKALMEQADLNEDGNLTAFEVRRWIELVLIPYGKLQDAIRNNAKDVTLKIIINIANMLGIIYDGYEPDAGELRKELVEELNNYQKIDANRDGVITGEELDEANKTLSKSTTAMRNNEEGLVDGYIDNYQGTYGSCWLLSRIRGIAKKAPELYNQMIKQDKETGEVTVTIPGNSGEPFIYKISKEKLLELKKEAIQGHRSGLKGSRYHSTDIEAIAFEKAFLALENKENSKILSEVRNYLDNSTIKKPEILRGINLNDFLSMSDEEIEATRSNVCPRGSGTERDLELFIKYTRPIDEKLKKPSTLRQDYDSYAEYIRTLVEYISNVDYELDVDMEIFYDEETILKPWVKVPSTSKKKGYQIVNESFSELRDYISISQSTNGVEKPTLSYYQNNVSVKSGGHNVDSFRMLLGSSTKINKYEKGDMSDNKIKKILENAVPNNKQVVCCGFALNDLGLFTDHAYLVESISTNGKSVILSNPHNSEERINLSIKDFLNIFENITIATLPDKIL